MPPIPAPRVDGFTTSTDVPLYWCAYGPEGAPRVLVLHGGPGASHEYLLPQMLALAECRELVFYDQRGGGRSRVDNTVPVDWPAHVDDLGKLATELEIAPLTILGYSWGGLLALLYAVEQLPSALGPRPSALGPWSLVLIDPAPATRQLRAVFEKNFTERQKSPVIQSLRDELAASGLRERDPEGYRHRVFELSVAGYFHDPRIAHDLTPFRVIARVQQSVWESLGDYDLTPRLRDLRVPTLIVHGREDPIPLESSETIAKATGAELVVIERCGHVPYVEQAASLFRAIDPFLDAHAAISGESHDHEPAEHRVHPRHDG
jgi:proline iminopeptidase